MNADRLGACPGTSAAFFRFSPPGITEKEHAYEDH